MNKTKQNNKRNKKKTKENHHTVNAKNAFVGLVSV